jgi:DNA-binding PadR family transcriptional regulator
MDIVMPGKMNGIEAAKKITDELDIPVVFVTSYADDAIIEKAKNVRPYGYIVKPFNELEIKAAIEVALFRKATEQQQHRSKKTALEKATAGVSESEKQKDDLAYYDLPEIKSVLLKDIFTDIVLYLYTEQVSKEPIFKFALEEGIKKGGRNLFSYTQSVLQKYFVKEIHNKELFTHRIRTNEVFALLPLLEKCTDSLQNPGTTGSLQILLDFSETNEFNDILAVRKLLLSKKEQGIPVAGIIAVNMENIDHTMIQSLSEGISKIIVSTGKETTLSFAHHTFPAGSVSVVSQSTIDDVVKKSLEPVVLSLLDRPISGYDIVHELENGYLEIKVSGKSKLYCPTEKGKKHFSQKLNDFRQVFRHILSNGRPMKPDSEEGRK